MKKFIPLTLFFSLMFVLLACKKNEKKIVGKWRRTQTQVIINGEDYGVEEQPYDWEFEFTQDLFKAKWIQTNTIQHSYLYSWVDKDHYVLQSTEYGNLTHKIFSLTNSKLEVTYEYTSDNGSHHKVFEWYERI